MINTSNFDFDLSPCLNVHPSPSLPLYTCWDPRPLNGVNLYLNCPEIIWFTSAVYKKYFQYFQKNFRKPVNKKKNSDKEVVPKNTISLVLHISNCQAFKR